MMISLTEQTKRNFCVAAYNEWLHKYGFCPGNHDVDYYRGWYYVHKGWKDEQYRCSQRPDITRRAEEAMRIGLYVAYSDVWNTFVLTDGLG